MSKSRTPTRRKAVASANGDLQSTVIWGRDVESEDYIKVPRVFLRLARYLTAKELKNIKPRRLMLVLALASRKYKQRRIRAYWEELADDLDVNKDTVRKWAYELRDKGLLVIRQHRGRDPKNNRVGYRNERNSFDIGPIVSLVEKAYKMRLSDRKRIGQEADDES